MAGIRIGLLGLGRLGRQIYGLACQDPRFDVVAIAQNGKPEVLCHLLQAAQPGGCPVRLSGNYLVSGAMQSRLLTSDLPTDIPWDAFGVDLVIDASGQHYSAEQMRPHLDNGAPRVLLSALPVVDSPRQTPRVILSGVNEGDAELEDRVVSAGSSSTTATALALQTILRALPVEHASMTSVHAYTSDQRLQDDSGLDYRRSRSGATNIIPNVTPALEWVQRCIPEVRGRLTGYALNVPVQTGSMLDLDISLAEPVEDPAVIQGLFESAAQDCPRLIEVTREPVVSSDVKGNPHSLLVDLLGITCSGSRLVKVLAWHETLGHAHRMLDVAMLYQGLSAQPTRKLVEVSQ